MAAGTTLAGNFFETEADAVSEAHQDWEARQARQVARTVYVEPQEQPEVETSPPEHYIVTLTGEQYHALQASLGFLQASLGLMGRYGDRGMWDAIKQAFEEARRVE